jgi:hypothetical protein
MLRDDMSTFEDCLPTDARAELIEILSLAREALAHPENDFAWSSWQDSQAALAELDGHIYALRAAAVVDLMDLKVLFAATGDLCEVSMSSGWSDGYLRLAERFDAAFDRFAAA